jgi:uncharacterized protein (TIGR02118 family)
LINAITLLRRSQDLSAGEFQQYWRHQHADVIAKLPGVQRYVQSHPVLDIYQQNDPVYDGIAELWADDSQAFRDIGASDAYIAVQADEENFLDRTAIALVLTDEHVVRDGPVADNGVKWIRLFNRLADMPFDEFQSYWREKHGPLVAALPGLDRYVQYHPRAGAYSKGRQPACDGFDMTWFGSVDALRAAMKSPEYDRSRSDQGSFLAAGDCPQVIAREHLITG